MNVSPSTEHSPAPRDHWVTALLIFALGAITGLVGDACHITSKTSEYASAHVPMIGCSAVWVPGLVGAFVVVLAWSGRALGLPRSRRTGSDVFTGSAAVLALYALTATMRGQTSTVSVALCASLAVLIWRFWDRSLAALG
ncbi:MAG TPA: hypothetical protein VGI70_13430, partial [Polyangiales bacterium]